MSGQHLNLAAENDPGRGEGKVRVLHPDHVSDAVLWNSFREGNEQAFVLIFDRSVKALHTFGVKITGDRDGVKDAVQELFIELWKNRNTLGETDSIKLYLYTCLRRKLLRQKMQRTTKMFVRMPEGYHGETTSPHEFQLVAEQTVAEKKQMALNLLSKLTRRQREAVFLRYFEEMEYDTIARVMELSKQVVYNLVHKAIDSLRSRR